MKKAVWVVAATVGIIGCGNGDKLDPSIENLGRATGPAGEARQMAAVSPDMGSAGPGKQHKGKVVETMNVPNYTYVRVQGDGTDVWAAIPSDTVEVGQEIAISESIVMKNFQSRTLDRTFESIVFGVRMDAAKAAGAPSAMPSPGALPAGHPPIPNEGEAAAPAGTGKTGMPAPGALPPGHPPIAPTAPTAPEEAGDQKPAVQADPQEAPSAAVAPAE